MDKTHNNTKFVCDKGGLLYVLGTMKTIDIKSLIIGALLASTIFLGVAATSPTDKWDKKQLWTISVVDPGYQPGGIYEDLDPKKWERQTGGAEPFAIQGKSIIFRKRIK